MSASSLHGRFHARPRALVAVTRHRVAVLVILVLAVAFYLWTAATSVPFTFAHADLPVSDDAYNLLSTAFLHGHLYLPLHVPAGLPKLSDPYNPTINAAYQITDHDLILYHDRFYSSWGPSSTLLFLLVRVTGWRLSNSLATAVYCSVGLVAAVGLLHLLARRFVPRMPDWMLIVATICIALANVAPFLLRFPLVYEVAVAGGYAFEMAGLYLVASATLPGSLRYPRLAVGSLLLGLGVLARPPLAVGLLVLVVVAVLLVRQGRPRARVLTATLLPFVICLGMLAAYNELRFGAAGQFGTRYELAGLEQLHKPTDQLAYIPPGLFTYMLVPPSVSLQFPHVFLQTSAQYPFSLPRGYEGSPGVPAPPEITGGLLPTMPITILLLSLPLAWWRRRPGERAGLWLITGGAALTLAIMLLLAWAVWGTTQRYEVDYATEGLISAFLLWGLYASRLRPGSWARRSLLVLGSFLALVGCGFGLALSIVSYGNLLQRLHLATYNSLRGLTDPLVDLATDLTGSPALLEIDSPVAPVAPTRSPYLQFDASGSSVDLGGSPLTLRISSPRTGPGAIIALARKVSTPIVGQTITVTSNGTTTTSPIIGASVRIPITLRHGINAITLQIAGVAPTDLTQVNLTDLQIAGVSRSIRGVGQVAPAPSARGASANGSCTGSMMCSSSS